MGDEVGDDGEVAAGYIIWNLTAFYKEFGLYLEEKTRDFGSKRVI